MHRALLACMLLTLTLDAPQAARVAFYNDAARVDAASASSLSALLLSLGHSTTAFSGASAPAFTAALSGADLVVFPQMAFDTLESGAIAAVSAFVSGGGGMIATGTSAIGLLDRVFYPDCDGTTIKCLASSGTSGASFLDATVAANTPYSAAPTTLGSPPSPSNAVNFYNFLPAGGLNLYQDRVGNSPNSTTALTAPVGSGHYGYLAWDFAGAVPNGTLDGGWSALLGIMANDVAAVPEPSALLLLAWALPLIGGRRGRRMPLASKPD